MIHIFQDKETKRIHVVAKGVHFERGKRNKDRKCAPLIHIEDDVLALLNEYGIDFTIQDCEFNNSDKAPYTLIIGNMKV